MTLTEEDLRELAAQTAALAVEQGTSSVALALDDSYIVGGANPAWGDNGTAGGWVTPTASLALEEGWLDGEQYGPKSADPAGDAARRFAELLGEEGLEVTGGITAAAAPEGAPAAEISSDPLSEIVRHTLLISDNTTAELLAHLVALSRGEETTPAGAAAAVEAEIRELGAEMGLPGPRARPPRRLRPLAERTGSPPALLAAVLAQVASGKVPPSSRSSTTPVAALSGTLADRFITATTRPPPTGARQDRLSGGAATLAGVTVLPDGRTVGCSIVVHGFDGTDADDARAAVDQVAAEMVQVD